MGIAATLRINEERFHLDGPSHHPQPALMLGKPPDFRLVRGSRVPDVECLPGPGHAERCL